MQKSSTRSWRSRPMPWWKISNLSKSMSCTQEWLHMFLQTLSLPWSRKEVHAFLGKINFLRRFTSNFIEMVKHITAMLRKGKEVKWTAEPRESFIQIKRALTEAPVLISLDYSKDFLVFSFASFDTVVAVLLQKNEEGWEKPIAFFSKALRDAEITYKIMEKQAYALVKSLIQSLCLALESDCIHSFSLCEGHPYTTWHRWEKR